MSEEDDFALVIGIVDHDVDAAGRGSRSGPMGQWPNDLIGEDTSFAGISQSWTTS
jgi:hypothetical protein